MSYEIKLPQFEGPFDLLLFFIERDELDIYDIPIANITNDFLSYLHHLEQMDLELGSEFMLVAATLMRIKAKMLLPRKDLDEQGNEIDPRDELVQKLVEYKKFKAITNELALMEDERHRKFKRGHVQLDMEAITLDQHKDAELNSLSLFNLLNSFNKVLKRLDEQQHQVQHTVERYAYTIEQQKLYLLGILNKKKKTPFETLFSVCENRIHAMFTFLAMLELIQLEQIAIFIGEGYNDFEVKLM